MSAKGSSGNSMDAKREEFRKYLEKEGVLEYLTKQLVRLYEEADKPSNALDYLKNNFSGKDTEVAQLKAENLEKDNLQLKEKIKVLESEKEELELKVKELQAASSASNALSPSCNSTQSPVKSPKDLAGKTESDDDEPMETGEEKSNSKSLSKNTAETITTSPRSKFDQPRSPALSENKEEEPPKSDDATSERMESEDSKAKTEGEDNSTSGDKSVEEGIEGDKKPTE